MIGNGSTADATDFNTMLPVGLILPYAGKSIPTEYLLCDGSAVSRTTYAALFAALCPSATFTVTIASPAVFTSNAHGLVAGDKIRLTTTGALPTGLAIATDYYVIAAGLTVNAFEVSTSRGGAAVNTSGSQSGTHTWRCVTWGAGDGSTTFNLPNLKGKTVYGYDVSDANFDTLNTPNTYVGEKTHQLTTAELAAHNHGVWYGDNTGVGQSNFDGISVGNTPAHNTSAAGGGSPVDNAGGDTAHNNMPPYSVINFIIRWKTYS